MEAFKKEMTDVFKSELKSLKVHIFESVGNTIGQKIEEKKSLEEKFSGQLKDIMSIMNKDKDKKL